MRRNLDAYYTPEKAVNALTAKYPGLKHDWVLEPCCGTKNISKLFKNCITADIDPSVEPMVTADMSKQEGWDDVAAKYGRHDWVVTNPPFSHALEFAQHGLNHAKWGMALLLRLSFLEPTYKRQEWLHQNPPYHMIVLPRISFTGDGKTDLVTCAWMIWLKGVQGSPITIERKF